MATVPPASAPDKQQIDRLLEAARQTIVKVRYCWLATRAEGGGANARAVRMFAGTGDSDEWSRRFLCRRGSRKVVEMRHDDRVTLAYQDDTGDHFVALGGRAFLLDDRSQVRSLWPTDADKYYPDGFADANMIVVRIKVDRIEIHARGVTEEPFGHGRTLIERETADDWRFVPA